MTWSSRIITTLRDLKDTGLAFDDAWRLALERHPPSARDDGYRETLFVLDGDGSDLSPVAWLHAVAGDAWHGRKPVLRYLTDALELVADTDDDSMPARLVSESGWSGGKHRHVA